MSKVIVIQGTKFQADVTPALKYGEISFALTAADRTSCSPELARSKLSRALRNFNPKEDYLLWAGGDPLSLMLTGAVLLDLGIREVRYLRYERPRPREAKSSPFYVPVTVHL